MLEFLRSSHSIYNILILFFSTLITLLCIPSILHVARSRHLYDDVGHFRKQHDHGIPRLGGVAIFVSFTISLLLFGIVDKVLPISYLLIACIILFVMGLKDDLSGVNSSTKLFIQFIVAAILVLLGDIRITNMYGIFGIATLPYIPSAIFSILLIMLIVNSFNLIDGVDGLAGVTGIIANVTFALLFIYLEQYELAAISLAITGAIAGFLKYNITPAKIFMGDTGALLIGMISAVMAIKFIAVSSVPPPGVRIMSNAPVLTVAILIGPVFDTLRVFTLRILDGKSPFDADRNHIHHRILTLGFNHLQTTFCLSAINILSIGMVFMFRGLNNSIQIIIILMISIFANWIITFMLRSKKRESLSLRNFLA